MSLRSDAAEETKVFRLQTGVRRPSGRPSPGCGQRPVTLRMSTSYNPSSRKMRRSAMALVSGFEAAALRRDRAVGVRLALLAHALAPHGVQPDGQSQAPQ